MILLSVTLHKRLPIRGHEGPKYVAEPPNGPLSSRAVVVLYMGIARVPYAKKC